MERREPPEWEVAAKESTEQRIELWGTRTLMHEPLPSAAMFVLLLQLQRTVICIYVQARSALSHGFCGQWRSW